MPLRTEPPSPSTIHLDPGRCLLFAYGQLQPGLKPPRSMSRAWPDRVRGMLYDLGPFPTAVKIDATEQWLRGYVLEIAENELIGDLDSYEEVDKGLYRRIRTTTEAGFEVWVYEYARPLPPTAAGPFECWPTRQRFDETGRTTNE